MNKRKEEIKRLVAYATGLGTKVSFKKSSPNDGCAAYVSSDNKKMVIYVYEGQSEMEVVLLLTHETAHMLDLIYTGNRETDHAYNNASDNLDDTFDQSKRDRKVILDSELRGITFWDTVIRDCNIQIPKRRIELQKAFDIFQYRAWYEYGKYPTREEERAMMRQLRSKFYV
jgi:hypothetical protein